MISEIVINIMEYLSWKHYLRSQVRNMRWSIMIRLGDQVLRYIRLELPLKVRNSLLEETVTLINLVIHI